MASSIRDDTSRAWKPHVCTGENCAKNDSLKGGERRRGGGGGTPIPVNRPLTKSEERTGRLFLSTSEWVEDAARTLAHTSQRQKKKDSLRKREKGKGRWSWCSEKTTYVTGQPKVGPARNLRPMRTTDRPLRAPRAILNCIQQTEA